MEGSGAILQQPVGELHRSKLAQAAIEFEGANLVQAMSEIPWFHNVVILSKVTSRVKQLWYAHQTLKNPNLEGRKYKTH